MLIKSNSQDWHCRMIVNLLWKNYMKRNVEGTVSSSADKVFAPFDQNETEKIQINYYTDDYHINKSPISSQTVKCENRRKLNMNLDTSNAVNKLQTSFENTPNKLNKTDL